jgi:hypothetical protein
MKHNLSFNPETKILALLCAKFQIAIIVSNVGLIKSSTSVA